MVHRVIPCINVCYILIAFLLCGSCSGKQDVKKQPPAKPLVTNNNIVFQNQNKVIHVYVALCDNLHQGIVPVPKAIGNGQDAANNLYWGCDFGIKTFFKNKTEWKLVASQRNPQNNVLERCIFRHKKNNAYLVADAWDGAFIKQCTINFIDACAGASKNIAVAKDTIGIAGNADVVAYIGHDGLMDFRLANTPAQQDSKKEKLLFLPVKASNISLVLLNKQVQSHCFGPPS